jgi:hypothetical protein
VVPGCGCRRAPRQGCHRGGVIALSTTSPEQVVFYDRQLSAQDTSTPSPIWHFISQVKLPSRFTYYRFLLSFDLDNI